MDQESFLDYRTIHLLRLIGGDGDKLLSQIICDQELMQMFDEDLDQLVAHLQLLAALRLVRFEAIRDDEDSDDIRIIITNFGRQYLESSLLIT